MDIAAFCYFWETAVNIASFMATPALQHSYGMNAVEDNPSATYLTGAVSNFGVAYAATQESLRNNNTSINAMQGQIQMLCNALGNQPLQACLNTHSKPTREVNHEAANVANNKTKANRDNPAAVVVALTKAVGKMNSTEATATVVGITKAAV